VGFILKGWHMSGVLIDVDTRTESADRDLRDLNRSLAALLRNANASGKAFKGLKAEHLGDVRKEAANGVKAFANFKRTGVDATRSVDTSASALGKTLGSVKNAAIALGTAFLAVKGVNAFNKAADDLTNIQNRLRLVTESADELIRKQNTIYSLSRETRSSFASTADTFVDFSMSLQNAGVSQTKILSVVKTIQQAGVLSGSTAEALQGAMIQLNQGIASGTLRGEELNSVMEQMKYLGIGLQQTLGKNAGELRKFAETGALTTEVLLDALSEMAVKTDADFKRTSITVESAMLRMRAALSYGVGDVNKYYGFSDAFAARLMSVTDTIESTSRRILAGGVVLRGGIKNYIDQFDLFDAASLTVKAMLRMEVTPLDAYGKYQQYSAVKDAIENVKSFFGKREELIVPVRPQVSQIGGPSPEVPPEPDAKGLKLTLLDVSALSLELVRTVSVSVDNIARILPQVYFPVVGVMAQAREGVRNFAASVDAVVYDTLTPLTRVMQAVVEPLSGFAFGDEELERQWVDLLKSRSLPEFTENLKDLNDARARLKLDELEAPIAAFSKSLRESLKPLRSVLVSLDLLDNELIRIRWTPLVLLAEYFDNIRLSIKRVYADVFATTLEPAIAALINRIRLIGETLDDVVEDYLTGSWGRKFGDAVVGGFSGAFRKIREIVKGGTLSDMFAGGGGLAASVLKTTSKIFKGLLDFSQGFFSGVFRSIAEAASPDAFLEGLRDVRGALSDVFTDYARLAKDAAERLRGGVSNLSARYDLSFDKSALDDARDYFKRLFSDVAQHAEVGLAKTENIIRKFGENVKETFFDVYDAVVGNSYWPDMVDGVVAYTENLFDAIPSLSRFADATGEIFRNLLGGLGDLGFGDAVARLVGEVRNIDWANAFKSLRDSVGAALLAGFGLLFGGAKLKLFAVGYFLSFFNLAVNGALGAFVPLIAEAVSGSVAVLTRNAMSGLISAVDVLVAQAPSVIGGIASAFLPVVGTLTDAISQIPILSTLLVNNLTSALILAGGAYAIFAEGGAAQLSELFMGKTNRKGVKSDGVIDYVKAVFGFGSGASESLLDVIFPGKALAVAAAAAFSTALLDSVSLIDAAAFGLPLLAFAMLGKDGGARLLSDTQSFIVDTLVNVYRAGVDYISGVAGADSPLTKFFEIPFNIGKGGGAQSSMSVAFDALLSDFKQLALNFRANAETYTAGQRSLSDSIFFGPDIAGQGFTMKGKEVELKKSMSAFLTAIADVKVGPGTLGDYFTSLSDALTGGFKRVRDSYRRSNILGSIGDGARALFAGIANNSRGAFNLMSDGLTLLASLLKNKFVLFGGLTAGFAATAFAASDAVTAVTDLSTATGQLLLLLGGAAAVLSGFGLAARSIKAYTTGKSVFENMLLGDDFADRQSERAKKAFEAFEVGYEKAAAARRGEFEKLHKAETARLLKSQQDNIAEALKRNPKAGYGEVLRRTAEIDMSAFDRKQREGFAAAERERGNAERAALQRSLAMQAELERSRRLRGSDKLSRAAGVAAVKDTVIQSFQRARDALGSFGVAAAAVAASPLMLVQYWTSAVVGIAQYTRNVVLAEAITARMALANKALAESFMLLKAGAYGSGLLVLVESMSAIIGTSFAASFGLFTGGLKGAFRGMRDLGGAARAAGTALTAAMGLLFKLLKPLWLLLKPFALITAGVTAVGALGLWLFGPANSFVSNLEWAYDKVRSLFGLSPATEGGKSVAVSQNLAPVSVGDFKSNFTAELARIDFDRLSTKEAKILDEVGATFKESVSNLETLFVRQGFLTEEQTSAAKAQAEEIRQILLRQPSKDAQTFGGNLDEGVKAILAVDNSLWAMVKRFVGYAPILNEIGAAAGRLQLALMYLQDTLSSWPVIIGGAIGALFSPIGILMGAGVGAAIVMVGDAVGAGFRKLKATGIAATLYAAFVKPFEAAADTLSRFWSESGVFREFAKLGGVLALLGAAVGAMVPPLGAFVGLLIGLASAGVFVGLREAVTSFGQDFVRAFTLPPSKAQREESAMVAGAGAKAKKYEASLPPEVVELLNNSFDQYEMARERFEALSARGFTGLEESTLKEFVAKRGEAEKEALKLRDEYIRFAKAYGDFGEENFNIAKFEKSMQLLAGQAKEFLALDVGKFGEQFLGTPADFDKLRDMIKQGEALKFKKTRVFTTDARNALMLQEKSLQDRAKALEDEVRQRARFETSLEFSVKALGVDATVDDVRRLAMESDGALDAFTDASKRAAALQLDIQDVIANKGAPAQIRALYERMGQARVDAVAGAVTSVDFSQLNERLQKAGLEQMTAQQFISFSEGDARDIALRIDRVRVAQEELKAASLSGKPFATQIAALKTLQTETRNARALLQSTISRQVADIASAGGSDVGKAVAIYEVLGSELPAVASSTTKGMAQLGKLAAKKATIEGELAVLRTFGNLDDPEGAQAFVQLRADLRKTEAAISQLEEVGQVFDLESVFSALSNVGLEIDKLSFAGLSFSAQKELITVAKHLGDSEKRFSEMAATGLAGEPLRKLLSSRQTMLERASAILEQSAISTGEAIDEALGGRSANGFAALSSSMAGGLVSLSKAAKSARAALSKAFDVSTPKGLLAAVDAVRKTVVAEREYEMALEDSNQTLETRLGSLNDLFKANLGDMDVFDMGASLSAALADGARLLKRELANVYETGKTSAGQIGQAFVASFERLRGRGAAFAFVADYGKTLREVTYEGAKAGFERLKSALPDLGLEFGDFSKMDAARRRDLAERAAQLELLERAAELPDLTAGMADVLNRFKPGDDLAATLDSFREVFLRETGEELDSLLKTASAKQIEAIGDNTQALRDFTAALTGRPAEKAVVESRLPGTKGAPVDPGAYAAIRTAIIDGTRDARAAGVQAATPRRKIEILSKGDFSTEALNLATDRTLANIGALYAGLDAAQTAMLTASETNKPALQSAISYYERVLGRVSEGIVEQANAARVAGETFSNGMLSGVRGAISGYLKGDAEDDKSAFSTFTRSLLNTFTTTVIESFVEGLMNPIKGAFEATLSRIGSSMMELGKGAFARDSGLDAVGGLLSTGGDAERIGGEESGVVNAILTLGGLLSAPLFSIAALTAADAINNLLGVTVEQAQLIYLGTLGITIPAAISAATLTLAGILTAILTRVSLDNPAFATGGYVSGPGSGTSDSIMARLSNGEFVVNAQATKAALPLLRAINAGNIPKFAEGGLVSGVMLTRPGSVGVGVGDGGGSKTQVFHINITGDVSRQTRSEIAAMLPQIATGVNSFNREKGLRR
jgi:tape measure domain-containing protein